MPTSSRVYLNVCLSILLISRLPPLSKIVQYNSLTKCISIPTLSENLITAFALKATNCCRKDLQRKFVKIEMKMNKCRIVQSTTDLCSSFYLPLNRSPSVGIGTSSVLVSGLNDGRVSSVGRLVSDVLAFDLGLASCQIRYCRKL